MSIRLWTYLARSSLYVVQGQPHGCKRQPAGKCEERLQTSPGHTGPQKSVGEGKPEQAGAQTHREGKSKQPIKPATTGVEGQQSGNAAGTRWGQLSDNNKAKSAYKSATQAWIKAFIERYPLDGVSQRAGHQADRQPLGGGGCSPVRCGPIAAALLGDGFGRMA